jgi:drug/metabolite transporter (DMT)-like permease
MLWGLVPAATRYVLETLSAGQLIVTRFLIASLTVLFAIVVLRAPMPERRYLRVAVGLGLIGTLGYNVTSAYGIQRVEAGTAALLAGMSPVFTALLAAPVLGERLRLTTVVGLGLSFVGSIVVAAGSGDEFGISSAQMIGPGLILFSGFMWGVYTVTSKPWLGRIPATSIPMLGSMASLPFVVPLGYDGMFGALSELNVLGWLAVALFTVGGAVIAPALYTFGLQRGEASRASMYTYLAPVFGVVVGAVLLDESVGPAKIFGGVLIIGGVALATLVSMPRPRSVALAVQDEP